MILKSASLAAAATVLLVGPAAALPQDGAGDGDDWDYVENLAENETTAGVRYDGDRSLIVHCKDGQLNVILAGWPVEHLVRQVGAGRPHFDVKVTRPDGRSDTQTWRRPTDANVFISGWPARSARYLRTSGSLMLAVGNETDQVSLELPLPSSWDNLDRAIQACDVPLEDDSDSRPNIVDLITRFPVSRTPNTTAEGSADVSCVISSELRMTDCRTEQVRPARSRLGDAASRAFEGVSIEASDPAAVVGGVLLVTLAQERIRTPLPRSSRRSRQD